MSLTDQFTVETVTVRQIAKTIDHSLLKPELTVAEVLAGCELAARYDVASVCCRPLDVLRCSAALTRHRRGGWHRRRVPARRQPHADQSVRGPAGDG